MELRGGIWWAVVLVGAALIALALFVPAGVPRRFRFYLLVAIVALWVTVIGVVMRRW